MEKKFSDKTLDFWEAVFYSGENINIDFNPKADPEKIAAEMRALRAAVDARRKEREQRVTKVQ